MNSAAVLLPPVRRVTINDFGPAVMYAAGCVAGGTTSATGLWVLSGLVAPVPAEFRGALLLGGLVWALAPGGAPLGLQLPQRKRQISQEVLLEGGGFGALQFGFEIGTGIRTHLPTTTAHVLALFLLFGAPTLLEALAVGLGFGLGRALQLMATALIRDRDSFLEGWHRPVATVSRLAPIPPVAVALAVVLGGARVF